MDVAARFGGDKFVVILNELDVDKTQFAAEARIVAEKLHTAPDTPYMLKFRQERKAESTGERHCTISIGLVVFFDHEGSQDHIRTWADAARCPAKEPGGT